MDVASDLCHLSFLRISVINHLIVSHRSLLPSSGSNWIKIILWCWGGTANLLMLG